MHTNISKRTTLTLATAVLSVSALVLGAQANGQQMPDEKAINNARKSMAVPSQADIEKHQKKDAQRASEALDRANQMYGSGGMPRSMPNFDAPGSAGKAFDPAEVAQRYLDTNKLQSDSDSPNVMIFASLSMPQQTLVRLAEQAKRAGAVVVFRGLKYSLREKNAWLRSMEAMEPIGQTGADVQIHPELFTRFNVTAVPTLVVTTDPKPGCQDDACGSNSASVVGDVSLDYALARLTDRKDEIGNIARDAARKLRNN